MLERNEYRASDMVFRIMCGFIDRATEHADISKMTTAHRTYKIFMSIAILGFWKQEWSTEV